jgi:phosphoserine phosphatase
MRSDQKTKKQRSPPSPRWPVYRHVIFDCDSTLTGIEGIDELASHSDTRQRVADLTRSAMDGKVNLETVYGERLEILQPTRGAVRAIRSRYRKHVVEDAAALMQALQVLGHEVYIVSGGLFDPVREFGLHLGVAPEHIRAVEVEYDTLSGNWWQGQGPWREAYLAVQHSVLTESDGKARVIRELLQNQTGRSLLVGDGVSDLLASREVDLFAGFGGVICRDRVASESKVFIQSQSIAPVLLLAAGTAALEHSGDAGVQALAEKAHTLTQSAALRWNEVRLAEKFEACFGTRAPSGSERDL